ncbi:unnamed protein product [Penicillium pancosmium]
MTVALSDLTISNVSGMIAVGVAVVQILIPIALPIILLGFFKSSTAKLSATTWSALAAELYSSYWPTILRADSSGSKSSAVSVVSWSKTAAKILTAVAAILTPLGLYQEIVAQAPVPAQFHYLEDTSVFGKSTPPRNKNIQFSRICGDYGPMICPGYPGQNTTWYKNATGEFVDVNRYDTSIPLHRIEAFQSGLSTMQASVSSIFDIQSRYTVTSQTIDSSDPIDNGTGYPISQLRLIQSLITDRGYQLVEGLVVDLQAGGVGFRNHTAPPWRHYGSEWSEDLLFIEPETKCIDVNLTIDYHIAESLEYGNEDYEDIVLTDRGGFSNLVREFSPLNWTTSHSQDSPELSQRAFTAAWVNNVMSMVFMNVTNPRNYNESSENAFRYLDSHYGKRFPLSRGGAGVDTAWIRYPSLQSNSVGYGSYLPVTDSAIDGEASSNSDFGNFTDYKPLYANPFRMGDMNFTRARFCQ